MEDNNIYMLHPVILKDIMMSDNNLCSSVDYMVYGRASPFIKLAQV